MAEKERVIFPQSGEIKQNDNKKRTSRSFSILFSVMGTLKIAL